MIHRIVGLWVAVAWLSPPQTSDAFTFLAPTLLRQLPAFPQQRSSRVTLTSSLSEDASGSSSEGIAPVFKTMDTEWSDIASISVQTLDNTAVALGDVLSSSTTSRDTTIVSCLSHFGDYNAWEMTQQYISAVKSGRLGEESPVVLVGIGSVQAAKTFANDIGLSGDPSLKDRITLVTDETGSVTEALDCYRGWLTVDKKHKERYPFTDVNPAIKLLGMIFGFGSPGTIGKVVEGYTGDVAKNYGFFGRQWVIQALTQGGEKGRFPQVDVSLDSASELQPFELATLRLQTGLHIVAKWGKLGPKDGDLFTRMGGTFIFREKKCIYEHFDVGILNFANMDDVCLVAEAAAKGQQYVPPSNKSQAKKNRQSFWERKDEEAKRQIRESIRRAEEAQREAERLAVEAKRAEEARLEELDRVEAERIAEMARQGEEARRARLEEVEATKEAERLAERAAEMARQAAEREKARLAEMEAQQEAQRLKEERDREEAAQLEKQKPSVSDLEPVISESIGVAAIEDEDFEASVDEILLQAEEQEKRIRQSLQAIQSVQKTSEFESNALDARAGQEVFQRSLLAARIKYDQGLVKINGASTHSAASFDKTEEDTTVKSPLRASPSQQENFQRELLAARIRFDKGSTNSKSQAKVTISVTNPMPRSHDGAPSNGKNGFSNGVKNGKKELFQRSLLASRLKYEGSNNSSTSNVKAEPEVASIPTPKPVVPDDALL